MAFMLNSVAKLRLASIKVSGVSITRKMNPFKANKFLSSQRSSVKSPYEILGVSKSATTKDIKIAYFREAKKFHPDLNPNDPRAKEKFQKIAAAYEILSDDKRRRAYDSGGYAEGFTEEPQYTYKGGQQQQQQYASYRSPEDVFNSVKEDVDVIKDAMVAYADEMKDELNYAMDCAANRDWDGVMEVAKTHKALIFGVVVPTVLVLRYPPAALAAIRVAWFGAQAAIAGLIYMGRLEYVGNVLWRKMIALSREQKQRAESRTPRKRNSNIDPEQ